MKKKILGIAITIMLITVGCGKPNYKQLETDFTSLAKKYYEEQLEGKVLGFDNHEISLEAMEQVGYDITPFTEKNCDKSSYSLIKLTLNEESEVVGDYEVENHLTCGSYSTPEEE